LPEIPKLSRKVVLRFSTTNFSHRDLEDQKNVFGVTSKKKSLFVFGRYVSSHNAVSDVSDVFHVCHPGPASASAGPDWNHFCGAHCVV